VQLGHVATFNWLDIHVTYHMASTLWHLRDAHTTEPYWDINFPAYIYTRRDKQTIAVALGCVYSLAADWYQLVLR